MEILHVDARIGSLIDSAVVARSRYFAKIDRLLKVGICQARASGTRQGVVNIKIYATLHER